MSKFFGVSMGETGQYGIGDIEPVYNVFQLKDENDGTEVEGVEIEYVK